MLDNDDWKPTLQAANRRNARLLYSGFPMVESVVFVAHPNSWSGVGAGNCYFTAMALLLYGTSRAWLRVKAEHLYYLEKVLTNKDHVRHEFYKRLNAVSSETHASVRARSGNGTPWQGFVNLWERLQIPNCWTSDEICALTADVYGVFLVLYSIRENATANQVYDLRTYGAFNNRHLFAAFKGGNHFVPLVPNNFYHYEFRLPRISLAST
ncbi:hypothetical protein V8F33_013501, partial [Rhypophila sp. PSN 637]